jgi:hypothetical protein
MTKRFSMILGATAIALLVSVVVGVDVSAQNNLNTHGIPTAEKVYGDNSTYPIKIDKRDYDKAQLLSEHVPDDVLTGRVLWMQKCAFCHDGVGQPTYNTMGPWLGAETVQKFGEDTVRNFVLNGDVRMPAFRYQLDTHQVDALISFLKSVPASQKPTPAQLAGRPAAGGGGSD